MSEVIELGAVIPIHMIGDSHCLAFSGTFGVPWSSAIFQCRTKYLSEGVPAASHFLDEDGALNQGLVNAFIAERLFDGSGLPGHLDAAFAPVYRAFLERRPMFAPAVVLFAGEWDIRRMFIQLGDDYDFSLPGDEVYGVNWTKTPIPLENVLTEIETLLKPLMTGVGLLKKAGFSRLMVHGLWPPTPDNLRAATWNSDKIFPDKIVRAKIMVLANKYLADSCREIGVPFITAWEETAQDGYLKPEFDLDGVHINRRAAALSLAKIIATLYDETVGTHNPMRYEMLVSLSLARPQDDFVRGRAWRDRGFVSGSVDANATKKLAAALDFRRPATNDQARPDWVGWPRRGRAEMSIAEPDDAVLERAAGLLGNGEGSALLHAGAGTEMTVVGFRPISPVPPAEAPVPVSDLMAPPGTRRAMLLLDGEGEMLVQSLSGETLADLRGKPGSLVVYDPQRVRCLVRPGGAGMRLAELSLIPRAADAPFRVVWAGLNDWPADPLLYSVAGLRAFPPFADELVVVSPQRYRSPT